MKTTDKDNDRRVSETYRDLAPEKTPPALDREVLAMAAGAARTRYGRTRWWVRPLAWAATIALSLAIVLEVTRVDDTAVPESVPRQKAEAPDREANALRKRSDSLTPVPVDAPAPAALEGIGLSDDFDEARAGAAAAVPAEEKEQLEHCDAAARQTAGDWYECIEMLRDAGLDEAAAIELAALHEAFPGFAGPGPDQPE